MKKYVIIGNGAAAAGCIEGIRKVDGEGSITVISEEKHMVYCRPLISYYLEGKTDEKRMLYRKESFYEDNGVTVLYGKKAVKINTEKKSVALDDGEEVLYDELCCAAGSSPFVPPFEGLDSVAEKYSFMKLDDALEIEKAVGKDSRVLIVGAGLIGLKCAEGLKERAGSITVCDLAPRVLSSILDDECAGIMQRHLEKNGIDFLLADTAVKFDKNKAVMKSGKEVEFDVLILAVGVRANIGLVKEAGGSCTRAITIDEHMRTSLQNIYAAGDCTEMKDISSGGVKVMALMPNAYMEGRCAGMNMAGEDEVFDNAIPMNSIGFFGLHAMTAGSYYLPEDGGELYEEKSEESVKRLFTKDGYLTGFILIGNVDRTGIYTNMIRNRIPLDTVDFDLLKKAPNLYAFGEDYRKNRLGGVV